MQEDTITSGCEMRLWTNTTSCSNLDPICFSKMISFTKYSIPISTICAAAKNWHLTYVKNPRVNDVMLFVPKHLHAYYLILPHHYSIDELVHHKELYPQQVDFMVYTYHDSDSFKDLNSGYKIVNRPEAKKTLTTLNRTIDRDFPMFKRS